MGFDGCIGALVDDMPDLGEFIAGGTAKAARDVHGFPPQATVDSVTTRPADVW